jgi:hypothetical protein
MNPVQVPQRRPRRCSQCRMEKCCKTHPMCPVNLMNDCLAFMEKYCKAHPLCPVNLMNKDLARRKLLNKLTAAVPDSVGVYLIDRIIRRYISINLDNPKVNCPDSLITRYIDHRILYGRARDILRRLKTTGITVTKTDTPCDPEECGICLEANCTVTTNCNHNYCVDCINGIVLLHRLRVNCAYCRCKITELKTHHGSVI